MYSDRWLRDGCQTIDDIDLRCDSMGSMLVHYKHWVDHTGALVGVTVSFEYADDCHIELAADDWAKLLAILTTGDGPMDETAVLKAFFAANLDTAFQQFLNKHQIHYDHIVFYDWPWPDE